MQEHNRHILLKAISKLPDHKAPVSVWDNIETMMLTVTAEILPVHEAPAALWGSIESEVAKGSFLSSRMNRMILISLLVVLISGAGIIYFSGNRSVQDNTGGEKMEILTVLEEKKKDGEGIRIKDEEFRISEEIEVEKVVVDEEIKEGEDITIKFEVIDKPEKRIGTSLEKLKMHLSPLNSGTGAGKVEIYPEDISRIWANHGQNCYFHGPVFNIQLGFNTEYLHFLNSFEPDKASLKNWFGVGLGIILKRNRWMIETGIGLAYSKDKLDYNYDYLTQELVNSYEYVDSVHVDPVTGQVQYFMTTVDVYDSIPYSRQTSLEKNYTYLQVPLLVGFDIARYRNVIFTLKGGITYFTQMKMKERMPDLYHENSRIIHSDSYDVSRKKDFFKVSAGICIRWHFIRKMNLSVSPSFHYFFDNIYEGNGKNKTISVGLRLGLYYNL